MSNVILQLVDIYLNHEDWHKNKLSEGEAYSYFNKLVREGNIFYVKRNGRVLGYMEVWFIDREQATRIFGNRGFNPMREDIRNGTLGYVHNAFIHERYRNLGMLRTLKRMAEIHHRQHNKLEFITFRRIRDGRYKVYSKRRSSDGRRENSHRDNAASGAHA